MKGNDIEQFSIALTKLATPLNVDQRKKIKSATKVKRGPHSDSFETPTDNDLEQTFPLPSEHDINQPFDEASHPEEGKIKNDFDGLEKFQFCGAIFSTLDYTILGGKTLLFLSIDEGVDVEFCRLLIKAGARADLFDRDLERAPIHEAVMLSLTDHTKALLETHPLNKVHSNFVVRLSQ